VREGKSEAPCYVRAHVVAFETVVLDEVAPLYYRLYAWWKLVSLWGVLRFDDHRGAGTGVLRLSSRGLEGCLQRTKTTGQGKKVQARPLLIAHEAYVAHASWLRVGWELWQTWAPGQRDYFLQPPQPGYHGVETREATYTQAATATRALHRFLPSDGAAQLLPTAEAAGYWTEHSPRNFLPSAAGVLEFPQEWIDGLGCWSPTGSRAYVRTVTARARIIQRRVAGALRCPGSADLFGEDEVRAGLADYLAARKAYPEELQEQDVLLQSFAGVGLEDPDTAADDASDATVIPEPSDVEDEGPAPTGSGDGTASERGGIAPPRKGHEAQSRHGAGIAGSSAAAVLQGAERSYQACEAWTSRLRESSGTRGQGPHGAPGAAVPADAVVEEWEQDCPGAYEVDTGEETMAELAGGIFDEEKYIEWEMWETRRGR